MGKKILGIDIGGSSVKYGIVDQDGNISDRGSFPVSPDMDVEDFTGRLFSLCVDARNQGAQGLGISSLGFVDTQAGMVVEGAENLPFIIHLGLKDAMKTVFPPENICLNNDANCFALGEMWKGNAVDMHSFFCLALGTGIGGSLVINRQLVQGVHFRTGEVGYFDYQNPDDYWEKKYSTTTFMDSAAALLGIPSISGADFMERIRQGDSQCLTAMKQWMAELGKKLANMILLLDLNGIIIGGAVSQSSDIMIPLLRQAIDLRLPPSFRGHCSLRPAKFCNDSAILGAVAPLMTADC